MTIIQDLLTINPYSRDGKLLASVKAIIIHWTANPNVSAKNNRDYFESLKNQKKKYGSAHYVVGLKGEVIQCIPDNEKAFHTAIPDFSEASKDSISKTF